VTADTQKTSRHARAAQISSSGCAASGAAALRHLWCTGCLRKRWSCARDDSEL